ncbi:PH domain-containing protein [Streptomyces sp. NPDC023838]|uniref:PH domain-containing protein n=1 Tax=Streptomyces sp. NPDC023838 TaxID=3154325 RepID=UPI0033D51CA1
MSADLPGAPGPGPGRVSGPGPASAASSASASAASASDISAPSTDGWLRLDWRRVVVFTVLGAGLAVGAGLPTALAVLAKVPSGWAVALATGWIVLPLGGGALAGYVGWRRTRYRIGPERAELHTGLLLVKRRSLARERIRSVDLTAHPLLRILGLVKVRIGTGEHSAGGESTLELDPVTRAEGERLRRVLLDRAAAEPEGSYHQGELAALDPGWIRYAPVSFVAPALAGAAFGGLMQISDWFGVQDKVVHWAGDRFHDTPLGWIVLTVAVAALVVGVGGALGLWVEMWWNYRLEREPGGTLRVRRGLLTSRSISIEERRLRGVELVEPLGVRLCGAARLDAIATGLAKSDDDEHAEDKTLLPPVPRAVAAEVAARVLREPTAPLGIAPIAPAPIAPAPIAPAPIAPAPPGAAPPGAAPPSAAPPSAASAGAAPPASAPPSAAPLGIAPTAPTSPGAPTDVAPTAPAPTTPISPGAPTGVAPAGPVLTPHPRAARGRRLRWAGLAVLAPVAVLALLGVLLTPVLFYVAAGCAGAGVPLAVALALDAYRNLGHGVDGAYLVARSGTVRRATVALQRGGVIGWTVKQSVFQRRAGLLTLTATTAAGAGAYSVRDAAEAEGLAFAAEAVPGLLEPFLIRELVPRDVAAPR